MIHEETHSHGGKEIQTQGVRARTLGFHGYDTQASSQPFRLGNNIKVQSHNRGVPLEEGLFGVNLSSGNITLR